MYHMKLILRHNLKLFLNLFTNQKLLFKFHLYLSLDNEVSMVLKSFVK